MEQPVARATRIRSGARIVGGAAMPALNRNRQTSSPEYRTARSSPFSKGTKSVPCRSMAGFWETSPLKSMVRRRLPLGRTTRIRPPETA